ncbi:hypothetical protein GALMADRAFT_222666 [Galerina marginata CBS 339.88]|uniref:Ribonucleoside-diphosphate reductase n=1 Tax=Galerina marginata (strain CBS 339.88) TaxID=685588 RepID=A0A067TDA3_GALM3|nr:hypothetical protein GALMADRAFT_222666 [Galerina marginata CBS 339.88]
MSSELEDTLAQTTAQLAIIHPAYENVAGRILMGRIHKETPDSFRECLEELTSGTRVAAKGSKILTDTFVDSAKILMPFLEVAMVKDRDFELPYFSVRAMEHCYLLRKETRIVERPQHMYMRIAVAIHGQELPSVVHTYNLLSSMYYVHSSPTMTNCGTVNARLTHSFAVSFDGRTEHGITRSMQQIMTLTAGGGDVGVSLANVPASGLIDTALTMTKGGVKVRRGVATVFIEPWHPDIDKFLELHEEFVMDTSRERAVFFGLWIPDLFMSRVAACEKWSLFDPEDVLELTKAFGDNFSLLYTDYEGQRLFRKELPARDIWSRILEVQRRTGGPNVVYKDNANRKSNQRHLGTVTHSTLCADLLQPCSTYETAVCNTATIVLPLFVNRERRLDFALLHDVSKVIVRNLNRIGIIGRYPSPTAAFGYSRNRSIGIGVLGLADAFIALRLAFESQAAIRMGGLILETIYHAAMEASCELVEEYGIYPTFMGSPLSNGQFQFDLWEEPVSNFRYNWDALRTKIRSQGVANSEVVVLMSTGDITQVSGHSEGCEPSIGNIFVRIMHAEEYVALSSNLVYDLEQDGLWNDEIRLQIMAAQGSVQSILPLPLWIKALYKTPWEINPRAVVDHAISRGPFVCQSQSLTLYIDNNTAEALDSLHFYAWRRGLKTGLFFLRSTTMNMFKRITSKIYQIALGESVDEE